MICFDFEKAFDGIPISLLTEKMKKFNVDPYLLPIIKDTLQNRLQFVNLNNSKSNLYEVRYGISQVDVSSPHYFNVFVNDLSILLISHVFQYADDVVLIKVINDLSDCWTLQTDLNNVLYHTKDKFINLNSSKSKHLRITMKKNILLFWYNLNKTNIETVSHHKHLGVIYNEKLSFNNDCDSIISKAFKNTGFLKTICSKIDAKLY